MTIDQDFYDALRSIHGCPHSSSQKLDKICEPCRVTVTKLVLLRDHYQKEPAFYR